MRWWLCLGLCLVLACGSDEESPSEELASSAYEGMVADFDFINNLHLADFHQDGLFVDFGTPAQSKYIGGGWRSGWGSSHTEEKVSFTYAGRRGRFYFPVDKPAELSVRVRLRPHGTRALTPYVNNKQLQSVFFKEGGDGFRDVDFKIPAEMVNSGENYLLLTFGGIENIDGEDVSVAVDWIRVGDSLEGDFEAPLYGSNVSTKDDTRTLTFDKKKTKLSWYVRVPKGGKLAVSYQQTAEGGKTDAWITPEGESSRTKLFSKKASDKKKEKIVDLKKYEGKLVRIDLGGKKVTISNPGIIRPPLPKLDIDEVKNVVVVLVDTLRASKLKVFNPKSRVKTPVLDELAKDSTVFENAQSPENWTKPAVGSILTSLHPMTHSASTESAVMSDKALLIGEYFKAKGFKTAGLIANGYISDRYGFDQGWDRYRNYIREEGASNEAENVYKDAAKWVKENKDDRFFLYVHTIDPHVPYDPENEFVSMYDSRSDYTGPVKPRMTGELLVKAKKNPPEITFSPSDVKRLQALHDGEITQHDKHMGTFIKKLKKWGLWENTAFVFVADHGEEFNEHGSWGHGHSIYQELLHVPFVVHVPKGKGRRVSTTVSTMDIGPTVVELAGLPPIPRVESRSLVHAIEGHELPGQPLAFSQFLDERRVMVSGKWKLIVRGNLTSTIFNLKSDPGEKKQLAVKDLPIAGRYMRIMQGQFLGATDKSNWLNAKQEKRGPLGAEDVVMDETLRKQLRELGYVN